MHCTNGIIIQLKTHNINHSDDLNLVLPRERSKRKRSFNALPTALKPYITKKRVDPNQHLNSKFEECKDDTNFKNSQLIDFMWVLTSTLADTPNWTGFNYLLHEQGDEEQVHTITYLPAINQSPTKLETVLELLMQSKEKAEALGLSETDVVLDQAIYAKAVEILQNPTYIDLKRFVVLRMGAFHTACIFIAVIGKRFADAGLRDLIVEARFLGMKNNFTINA